VLLIGPSGCGKTFLIQTLARLLKVPFTMADATSFTESGYVGQDVENMLSPLIAAAEGDIKKAENGIVYLDEFDKLAMKGGGGRGGVLPQHRGPRSHQIRHHAGAGGTVAGAGGGPAAEGRGAEAHSDRAEERAAHAAGPASASRIAPVVHQRGGRGHRRGGG